MFIITSKKFFLCVLMSCMKVLPLNLNFITTPHLINNKHNKSVQNQKSVEFPYAGLSSVYYSPISFSGDSSYALLVNDLKSLNDMHCPYCGTKMLSREEMKNATAAIDKINSVNDLFKFLNKYEECVNPRFKNVVAVVKQTGYANFGSKPEEVLELCSKKFAEQTDNALKSTLDKLELFRENFDGSDFDKMLVAKYQKVLTKIPEKHNTRRGLTKEYFITIKNFRSELQTPEKFKIYGMLCNDVRDAFCNESLFIERFDKNASIKKTFLRNLLSYSKSDVHTVIEKAPAGIDNIILSCQNCEITNNRINRPNFKKEAYFTHVYELCREALNGNLHANKAYPLLLRNNVIKSYNNKLAPDNLQSDMRILIKDTGISVPRYVEFPLTDIPGIYCASCGQKTITHDQKAQIYDEIESVETMPELLELFYKYKEFVKPRYEPLLNEFSQNLMQNPHIRESSMVKSLRVFVYKNLQDTLLIGLKNIEDLTDDYELTSEQSAAFRKFISKANTLSLNLRPDTIFPIDEYHEMLLELTKVLKGELMLKVWDNAYPPVIEAYSLQLPLIPMQTVLYKGKSTMKIMAETIFNRSLATVDHLDPKYKYSKRRREEGTNQFPENKNRNLVVMCRDCNSKKSSTSLNHWVKSHPEMIKNMEKYIKQVKQLRKDKVIGKSFDYYPYEVAAQFAKFTGIDISTSG